MFGWIESRAWQVGAMAAGTAALAMAVALGVTTLQKNGAVRRAEGLQQQIDNPITGYRARLSSCQGNLRVVEAAIAKQNRAVEDLRQASDARVARAQAGLAAAQQGAAAARFRADRLLGATISGDTVCDRVSDADRQVLEMLK